MLSLQDSLTYQPVELAFGTSGLRGLVSDMTDLECYINVRGFLNFLENNANLASGATVYLAGDLRDSTPRIMRVTSQAITDGGYLAVYCGLIPTPAVAYYALLQQAPSVMVTGSHIPADRNGIKFNKADGEVLKADELGINEAVAAVRETLYTEETSASGFAADGTLQQLPELLPIHAAAAAAYLQRYTSVFSSDTFTGREIVLYQHSAVGRDMFAELLGALGATVVSVGRSDTFVPIDSENVTTSDQVYFKELALQHPDAFAIVSTDGDSDRPFVVDETGTFHRGDVLGAMVADQLDADFAAFPASTSDAVDDFLDERKVLYRHTKIGSPYVIVAMQEAVATGKQRVTGWEVNGGFLLGGDVTVGGAVLSALPTRDAVLPILVALKAAAEKNKTVSALFTELPQRFTQAGLINDFPVTVSKAIVQRFSDNSPAVKDELARYFTPDKGFGSITNITTLDGVRIFFEGGDIAHLRPSSNAPQLRIYTVADTQARADEIVALSIAEPDGVFRQLEQSLKEQ